MELAQRHPDFSRLGDVGRRGMSDPIRVPYDRERPASALARGVIITEFNDARVNPNPVVLEEADILLEEYLSPRKLRALTGTEHLENVKYLEMKVDTRETSLGNFGSLLPSLTQLKVSNSIIDSVRDLGSSLESVRVLWMARSCTVDLSGLAALSCLVELYLAYNEVEDLSPCGYLENVQILDLEGNNIDDIEQVDFLGMCTTLKNLTLEGNPICVTPSVDEESTGYDYRYEVSRRVKSLNLLDDEPVSRERLDTREKKTKVTEFDEDWTYLTQLMQEVDMEEKEHMDASTPDARPVSSLRPTTGYRPGSALRPTTTQRRGTVKPPRPGTRGATGRPGSGRPLTTRPGSARPASGRPDSGARPDSANSSTADDDASSDLTRGGVLCGNVAKALRSRTRQASPKSVTQRLVSKDAPKVERTAEGPTLFTQLRHQPEHSYEESLDDTQADELYRQLREFKESHKKLRERIEADKAPQVLTIDHAEDVFSSDEEGEARDATTVGAVGGSRRSRGPATPPEVRHARGNGRYDEAVCLQEGGVDYSVVGDYGSAPLDSPITPPSPHTPAGSKVGGNVRARRYRSPAAGDRRGEEEGGALAEGGALGEGGPPTPEDDLRPISGPSVIGPTARFRLDPSDKRQPKVIDNYNPVVRMSPNSPHKPPGLSYGPRANTSRAALQNPVVGTNLRRQLPKVPGLPSKPSFPK